MSSSRSTPDFWNEYYDRRRQRAPSLIQGRFNREVLELLHTVPAAMTATSVLEIGGGGGTLLAAIQQEIGATPFAIDFSPAGAAECRTILAALGADAANVIEADVFDPAVQEKWANHFELVSSFGFVEHFERLERTLSAHVGLVAPGGLCLITMPAFRNRYNRTFCRWAKGRRHYESMTINETIDMNDLVDGMSSLGMEVLRSGSMSTWPVYRPVSLARIILVAGQLASAIAGNALGIGMPPWLGATMYVIAKKRSAAPSAGR